MEYKKILVASILMVFFLMPSTAATAQTEGFQFQDKVTDTTSLFFLVALDVDQDDNLLISITHEGNGDFNLFLFNFRPNKTNVNIDKTFNNEIYGAALMYDQSDTPELNYTHTAIAPEDPKSLIYYVQIVLLNGGPDFFTLESNLLLVRYYLPALPGYSLEMMLISSMISVAIVIIFIRRRRRI